MLKLKIIITIFVSVIAMVLFETILNGIFFPTVAHDTANPGILKYFAPSIIAAIIVVMPMALNYRPNSLKLCLVTALIWAVLDLLLLDRHTENVLASLESVLFISVTYGPKLAAVGIFILAGYIVDKKFVSR